MKFLFVSYNMGIWVHTFPEALIADSLRKEGHEVKFLHCDRVFNQHCTTMSAYGENEKSSQAQKEFVCSECIKNKTIVRKYFKFDTYENSSFLSDSDIREADRLLSEVTLDNFESFSYKGISIGKSSLYEPLIRYKKRSMNFSNEEFVFYKIYLRNALLSLISFIKVFDLEKPDSVVMYSSEYATNFGPFSYVQSKGINVYSMFAGMNLAHRLQSMVILKGSYWDMKKTIRKRWSELKETPVVKKNIRRVTDHYKTLFGSNSVWAYSSVKTSDFDIRDFFKIKPERKIIGITMSTYDEIFGSYGSGLQPREMTFSKLFYDQVDWVKHLTAFAKTRQDLHFIFRVHPRDFPNKREQGISEQALQLLELFKEMPENCSVNWPDQNISLYDLAEEVDLFLNGHSSTGVEMTFLGFPVVLYDPNIVHYPPDLNYHDPEITFDGYFRKIDEALAGGWSFENTRKAYRWLNLWQNRLAVDISDAVPFNDSGKPRLTLKNKLVKALVKYKYPAKERQLQSFFLPSKLKASGEIKNLFENNLENFSFLKDANVSSVQDETENIKDSLRDLYRIFYKKEIPIKANTLRDRLSRMLEIK
ncbi:hypothetical protein [Leptospira ilyithenensis]|uniref:Uncharacterized protein n=1 Tax=Leptospira ilyithenensis TaxID=2484901 RepID=A0A4R9LKF4_9LEPT|nr:hypothetical protein [Leptospira ilyithenensis]TGN08012.1 hypothetical protein EHS11_13825 [Leptospira ilyithenensis]